MSEKEEWDDEKIFIFNVAGILDFPSVFMGGPSRGNMRRAKNIWDYLAKDFNIQRKQALDHKTHEGL